MDQQPGRRQPARGQGRGSGRTPGRAAGGPGPGPGPDESAEEQPNVVRPFVRHAEKAQKNQQREDQRRTGQGRSAPVASRQPEPERSNLVPTPLPAPRAVARQVRPGEHAPAPEPRPMSDLTTTMPILTVPIEDSGDHNVPPGEPGHFHEDGEFGRHRGGGRSTRLKAAGILVGVVVAGAAVAGTFAGGSGKPTSPPQAGGDVTTGAAPASDSAVPDPPGDSAATARSTPSHSPTPTPTPTRSTHTTSPKPSTSASTTVGGSPTMVSRPSSEASTPSTTTPSSPPPTTPTTSAPPPFTPLHYRDSGPAVTKLQADLTAVGYDYAYRNGYYDGATRSAVTDFQFTHAGTGEADGYGVYGVATNKALQAAVSGKGG